MAKKLTQEEELDIQFWMEKRLRPLKVGQKISLDYMGMSGELDLFCVERQDAPYPLVLTLRPVLYGVSLPEVKAIFEGKSWRTK